MGEQFSIPIPEGRPHFVELARLNDDGRLDLADVIFLLQYIFLEGTEPPPPFPDEGFDVTCDLLDCAQ